MTTERAMNKTFGNGGFVALPSQELAEFYLVNLPYPYCGHTTKTATGWAVCFRIGGAL